MSLDLTFVRAIFRSSELVHPQTIPSSQWQLAGAVIYDPRSLF